MHPEQEILAADIYSGIRAVFVAHLQDLTEERGEGDSNVGHESRHERRFRYRRSKGSEWSLFVGNLAFDIKEDDLNKRFSQFGDINDIYIPTFVRSGRKKGYAFVRFRNKEDAQKAKEMLNDRFIGRRRMVVNDAS
ncbi:serine/arginine-rich SC35-like splicing factor SCL28 [Magnolia sinica]|uniref:serine/arginine-rich SC35-like splicing factor SCL28 n=1 Tax=Magnolia sinica TaxID=86752 RepID=UPI00265A6EA2|nr:serine/arginine-rich SC35-like splicing factor SCL28 [Magnolia sinica]